MSRDSAAARPTKHFFLNERTSVDQCLYRCWAGPHGELDGRVWSRNSCCVERRHFPGACCRHIVTLNRNRADAPRALVLGLRFVVRSVTIPIGGCRMLCHVSNVAEVPLCRTVIWTPQRPEPASRSCGEPGPWLILGVHPRTLLSQRRLQPAANAGAVFACIGHQPSPVCCKSIGCTCENAADAPLTRVAV